MSTKTVEVWCTFQIEATHSWDGCPFDEVYYLRSPHRHLFHVKAYKLVTHADRDVEFIMLKHHIVEYLRIKYWKPSQHLHVLGGTSCEMLATELCEAFNLSRCEVSEDLENGAIVTIGES